MFRPSLEKTYGELHHVKFTGCELCEQKLKFHSNRINRDIGLKFCMGITNGIYLLFANDGAHWKRFWKILMKKVI